MSIWRSMGSVGGLRRGPDLDCQGGLPLLANRALVLRHLRCAAMPNAGGPSRRRHRLSTAEC